MSGSHLKQLIKPSKAVASLADILVSKQTDFVGTLKLHRRDVPQKVKEAKLKLHSKIKLWF